ncbi:MAG: efflux RND transporter periplasmic adaptor subunit [Deltaproteobacteria bacterium]|nr:efflux RND transporter periplasmic adaptor subunit [Deltaproteobacteria bacterium]
MKTSFTIRLIALCALTSVVLLGGACQPSEGQAAPLPTEPQPAPQDAEPPAVETQTLVGEQFTSHIEATGTALPIRESHLSGAVAGTIKKIKVDEGDRVTKGQLLLQLDKRGFQLMVQQARAGLAAAKAQLSATELELERAEKLIASEAAPRATYDRIKAQHEAAQAQVQLARAQLAQARKSLNDSSIRAPYDGVITEVLKEEGEFAPSMPLTFLLKLVDTSSLEVQVFMPEEVAAEIAVGTAAAVELESAGVKTNGAVSFVSDRIQAGTQTFEIRIKLDNAAGQIKAGAFSRVRLVRRSDPAAVLVQVRAVLRDEHGEPYVLVAKDGRARRVAVRLGETSGNRVLIVDGLVPGQQMIVTSLADIADGDAINAPAGASD